MKNGYELKVIKNIQVLLHECGLYNKKINGIWDTDTLNGYLELYNTFINYYKLPLVSETISVKDQYEVILSIQSDLYNLDLFDKDFSGKWCLSTDVGFKRLLTLYKSLHNCNEYSYGWSKHIPDHLLKVLTAKAKKFKLTDKCVSQLLTVICYETEGKFFTKDFILTRQFWFASKVGLTTEQLLSLTDIEKLNLVLDFFIQRKESVSTLIDTYKTLIPSNHTKKSDYKEVITDLYYEGLLKENRISV